MHCISLAILSRMSLFPSPAVGTNQPFCVDVLLNNQSIKQSPAIGVLMCLTEHVLLFKCMKISISFIFVIIYCHTDV